MKNNSQEILRYFEALKEFHQILKYTGKVSITHFLTSKKIPASLSKVLQSGKIIENVGSNPKQPNWKWVSIEPNMKMAEEAYRRINIPASQFSQDQNDVFDTIEEKYLSILEGLKVAIEENPNVSIVEFCKKRNVNGKFSSVINKIGIVRRSNNSTRNPNYKWIGATPSMNMAKSVLKHIRNIDSEIKTTPNITTRVSKKIKYSTFRTLWGLIKIRIEHHY